MEATLHVIDYKFHKPEKWRNNKNALANRFLQNLRKIVVAEFPSVVLLLRLNW